MVNERQVSLREERSGSNSRFLSAWLDTHGNLHLDGHDLGPGTGSVSSDGEYEWFDVIDSAYLRRLVALLDGDIGDNVLDLLKRAWTGTRSYEFERRLRESDIPVARSTWS